MGLLSRVSRLFGGQGGSSVDTAPGDNTYTRYDVQPAFRNETESSTATLETETEAHVDADSFDLDVEDDLSSESDDTPRDESAGRSESSSASELTTEVKPFTPAATKKSRQELIEELSRNYQEVLQLVRKVSTHLDKEEEREQRVTELAKKVEHISSSLDTMPDRINDNAGKLNKEIVSAIDRQAQAENKALEQVIEQARKSGEAQGKLVTTMAEFRETMSDVSKSGARSNEILAEMSRNANETREEIAQLIVTSKRWTTVAMVASLSVAVVAIVIAAISLMTGG